MPCSRIVKQASAAKCKNNPELNRRTLDRDSRSDARHTPLRAVFPSPYVLVGGRGGFVRVSGREGGEGWVQRRKDEIVSRINPTRGRAGCIFKAPSHSG